LNRTDYPCFPSFLLIGWLPAIMEKVLEGVIEGALAPHGAFAVFVIKAVFEVGSKVVKAVQKFNGNRQENKKKGAENEILQQNMADNKIRHRILKEKLKRERLKTQYLERKVAERTKRSQKEQRRSRQDQTRRFRSQQSDTGSETSSDEPDDFLLTQDISDDYRTSSEETCNIARPDVIALQGSIIIIVREYSKYFSSNEEKEKFLDFSIDFFESKGAFGNSLQLTVEEFTDPEDVLTIFSNYYFIASAAFRIMRDYSEVEEEDQLPEPPIGNEHNRVLITYQSEEPDDLYSFIQANLWHYDYAILRSSLFYSSQTKTFFLLLRLRPEIEIEEFLSVSAVKCGSFKVAAEINQKLFKSFFDPVSIYVLRLLFSSILRDFSLLGSGGLLSSISPNG
jgi:hypothetical protein